MDPIVYGGLAILSGFIAHSGNNISNNADNKTLKLTNGIVSLDQFNVSTYKSPHETTMIRFFNTHDTGVLSIHKQNVGIDTQYVPIDDVKIVTSYNNIFSVPIPMVHTTTRLVAVDKPVTYFSPIKSFLLNPSFGYQNLVQHKQMKFIDKQGLRSIEATMDGMTLEKHMNDKFGKRTLEQNNFIHPFRNGEIYKMIFSTYKNRHVYLVGKGDEHQFKYHSVGTDSMELAKKKGVRR